MSVHPILLATLLADVIRHGEARCVSTHGLGPWGLAAQLPDTVSLPTQATRMSLHPNPPALEAAGLSLDMVWWPLKPGLLSLGASSFTLGREPGNDLVVPHADISKRHARLFVSGEELLVQDLGSANGISVQGVPAGQERRGVNDGQTIALGAMALMALKTSSLMNLLRGA